MSDAASLALARKGRSSEVQSHATALVGVAAFWWLATGILIAVQRNDTTRSLAIVATTLLSLAGLWLIGKSASVTTRRGVAMSFLGGALAWLGVMAALYGGWIVGLPIDETAAPARSFALALDAIAATLYSDLLGLVILGLAFAVAARGRNRTGVWTIALFWSAHQTAKLNVFLGVDNAGLEYLPRELSHLARFFGPAENSVFLPLTIIALCAAAFGFIARFRATELQWMRMRDLILAIVLLLAALEHAMLGMIDPPSLWSLFLQLRGQS